MEFNQPFLRLILSIQSKIKHKIVKVAAYLKFSTYSKFQFSHHITESQAFVLVFARKTTEFLTAKHKLS